MTRKFKVTVPYNYHLLVDLSSVAAILDAQIIKEEYQSGFGYRFSIVNMDEEGENTLRIEALDTSRLVTTEPEVIQVDDILAENNRLTRELEALKAKYKVTSTELEVV